MNKAPRTRIESEANLTNGVTEKLAAYFWGDPAIMM